MSPSTQPFLARFLYTNIFLDVLPWRGKIDLNGAAYIFGLVDWNFVILSGLILTFSTLYKKIKN